MAAGAVLLTALYGAITYSYGTVKLAREDLRAISPEDETERRFALGRPRERDSGLPARVEKISIGVSSLSLI